MRTNRLLTVALSAGAALAQSTNWTVGQRVQTSSGPVDGHAASVNNGVSVYLGIPYAIPPVGDLRWTVAQAYTSNTTNNGSAFGFSCPASFASFGGGNTSNIANVNLTASAVSILGTLAQNGDKYDEDCLTVNIWTKPQVGDAKKAVLVWIYGGGFDSGTSSSPGYDGQYWVEQEDVVLVSFNYRLNIFGFPGSADTNTTQNLGLLDQRLALEWVRTNVANFGGDVDRITIFGQSAGGASVDYYSYAWVDDPIVAGFIPQSGTATGLPVQIPLSANASFYNVAKTVGCSGSDLACMRKVDYNALLQAIVTSGATFGPTQDEKVVFANYTERSLAGNFIKKPVLIGNANYEAGLFRTLYALAGTEASDDYWLSFDDMIFDCPAALRANVSISNGVPTWRYRWFGAFPNTELTSVPFSGAWHASELSIIFDTTPTNVTANTPEEVQIGNWMRGAWAAFAKDPEKGLSSYMGGWPMYNPGSDTLAQLAYANQTGLNLIRGDVYDGYCGQYAPIYEVTGSGAVTSSVASGSSSQASTMATSTSSAAASVNTAAIAALVATIPSCALGPLSSAITAAGCGVSDYACQCGTAKTQITTNASGPILKACSSADALKTQGITDKICGNVSTPSSGSSSGGTPTTTGATSTTSALTPSQLSAIVALVGTIPSCALAPLTSAIAGSGCGVSDYVCQCTTGKPYILSHGSPAILKACPLAQGQSVSGITDNICVAAGVPASATGASSAAASTSATGTHATDIAGVLATATAGQCISANNACNPNLGSAFKVEMLLLGVVVGFAGFLVL